MGENNDLLCAKWAALLILCDLREALLDPGDGFPTTSSFLLRFEDMIFLLWLR